MAGIGQYTMGRAMMPDYGKPVTTYAGNVIKRSIFGTGSPGNTGTPTFSDVANYSPGYISRAGLSQRNGEVFNSVSGNCMRNNYSVNPESCIENGPMYYHSLNFNGGIQRSFLESNVSNLSTISRTISNDLSNNRVGVGGLTPTSVTTMSRNCGNVFSNSLVSENGPNLSSSRGVTLDPSEFPPIVTSTGRTSNNQTSFPSSTIQPPIRKYISTISKGLNVDSNASQVTQQFNYTSTNQSSFLEFSKHDFPALPGSQPVTTNSALTSVSVNSVLSVKPALSSFSSLPNNQSSIVSSSVGSNREFDLSTSTNQSSYSVSKLVGSLNSLQLLPNHLVTNIPKNMIYDQFGMIGLLKLIRVGDHDTTLNMLAPGLDLSALHNNWQILGELYSTFISPCHDSCIGRPHDLDYSVPPEYLIRHLITDHLPDPPMSQLSEETLFWLFYNCCREEVQLVVAKELYQREWRFHKKEQIWLTRMLGGHFTTDNNSEQGDYYFWDPQKAQKSTHQMSILYSDLDNAPTAFRVSSNALSAFVTVDPPGGGAGGGSNNMAQMVAYQHLKTQQPQPYSHAFSVNNNVSGNVFSAAANSLSIGPTISSSPAAINVANFLNTRLQPGLTSVSSQSTFSTVFNKPHLNQSPNYYPSHGRNGQLNTSFTSKPSNSIMSTNNSSNNNNNGNNNNSNILAVNSSSNEGNLVPVSAFPRTSTMSLLSENNVHNQSVFENSQL